MRFVMPATKRARIFVPRHLTSAWLRTILHEVSTKQEPKRIFVTTVRMTAAERDALHNLAVAEDRSLASIWRRMIARELQNTKRERTA